MSSSFLRLSGAFGIALLIAGCASFGSTATDDAAPAPHPLAGAWEYAVDTPQGVYTGSVTFRTEGDSLIGSLIMEMAPDDPIEFGADYDSETGEVNFTFDSGEYGIMDVTLTLAEGVLTGQQFLQDYNMHLDVSASRKEDTPSQ